jgi:pheromone shutdown protein TraB
MFQTKNAYKLKRFMEMHDKCPVCEQLMEIEVGFYYGTSYVSYALTVAISVITFVAWWILIGMSVNDNRFFWWMGFNITLLIVLQPYLMRLSRAIWLSFFVRYNANWQAEKPDGFERG